MWVKRGLVILPVLMMVFLAQSLLWVPRTQKAADNEYRHDRIIFYMGGDPKDMNPWSSTTTTDSSIYRYFYEGLLRYNADYVIEPWLSDFAAIHHELVAPLPGGMTEQEFREWVEENSPGELRRFELASEAGTPRYFDLEGKAIDGEPQDVAHYKFVPPATYNIEVRAAREAGKITSAVQPTFAAELYKERRAKHFQPENEAPEPDDSLTELMAAAAALPSVKHSPVVEMKIRPGVRWTDGPFFTPWEKLWVVSVNGDQVAPVNADSADAAIELVRGRVVEKGQDADIKAWRYEERFGDDDSGPWWGKGPELKARDAKLTFDLIRDPDFRSPRLSSWADVSEVRMFEDDEYRLEVVYSRLFSPAISNLAGVLLPYHIWNETAWFDEAVRKGRGPDARGISRADYLVMRELPTEERDFRHRPSSIGPMVLEPLNGQERPLWKISERVTMRRNEFHWGRKPEFQFMDYYVFDPALGLETAEIVFNSGGMDIYTARDFQVKRYREMRDRYYVLERETTTYTYIGFNCSKEPLSNPRVRRALGMALNVDEVIKYVIYEQGQRIAGPAYPVLPWYDTEYTLDHTWLTGENKGKTTQEPFLPNNLVEAKAMLLDAGFAEDASGALLWDGKPFEMQMVNSSGAGPRRDISMLAREQWQRLGISVKYQEYEWNVFISQYIDPGQFDVMVLGWSGGLNFDKRQLFHSRFTPPNGLNFVRYSNPEADELMERILAVYDQDEQVRLSHGIFKAIADDVPYIFLFSPYSTSVMDRRIVWRKQVGVAEDGSPLYEDRPVNHEEITGAKQVLSYFAPEFLRREQTPEFTEQDRKR